MSDILHNFTGNFFMYCKLSPLLLDVSIGTKTTDLIFLFKGHLITYERKKSNTSGKWQKIFFFKLRYFNFFERLMLAWFKWSLFVQQSHSYNIFSRVVFISSIQKIVLFLVRSERIFIAAGDKTKANFK